MGGTQFMYPIIGITSGTNSTDLNENSIGLSYINAIESAGGIPIVFPLAKKETLFDAYLDIIDGLLLSGGVDLDPSLYGEESKPEMGRIDVERDRIEIFLTKKALKANIPILGICRGIQTLNVAAGGTLYQDIPTEHSNTLKHRQNAPGSYGTQTINAQEGSRLLEILDQPTLRVNSFHHQAVKKIAPDFMISAVASDGIIEGIESGHHNFVIGVQFHPELMWQDNPPITALFVAFVNAARSYRQNKHN
jgi:putative glutamine amidotransferase